MNLVITGANSSVGQHLLKQLQSSDDVRIVAGVRSSSASQSLPQSANIEPQIIDYQNVDDLTKAFANADCVIHLAGILIEQRNSRYQSANVDATANVVAAAKLAGASRLIFISVIGASATTSNSYFRSKGVAEQLVQNADLPYSIIRTPLLLGENTAGAQSLCWTASAKESKILGGGNYLMRPLDVDDLCRAIIACSQTENSQSDLLELAGPEPISYRELILRTAELLGNRPTIKSVPILLAKLGAAISSRIKGGGISPTVIDVITQDEQIASNADVQLGLTLTPLADTLAGITQQWKNNHD